MTTADGFPLAVSTFGDAATARAVVLVWSALGVPRSFYAPFAEHLATRGFLVVTADYRGLGDSAPPSLRGFDADLTTWAERDVPAVLAFARRLAPGRKLLWVGHSLGGQLLGLTPSLEGVAGAVVIASGSGYWRQNSPQLKRVAPLFWFGFVPALTPLFGYFPGRRLRMVGDLPKGAVLQWRAWCLHPEYALGVEGPHLRQRFGEVTVPLRMLSWTDDEMMSKANSDSLLGFFARAPKEHHRVAPSDVGVARIGHFGFFRATFRDSLWPKVTAWLDGWA